MASYRWFDREFDFAIPAWMYPNVVERLRGTPARLEELVRPLTATLLTTRDGKRWSIQEHAGHLWDVEMLWDARLYDYGSLYDTEFTLNKSSRLHYHQTRMTHAMLFTGVDVVGGKPRRWRVENSWGHERGKDGFFTMNDSWFNEYMFEIAARKKYLPARLRAALEKRPRVLPPWDPMGALAG